MKNYEGHDVLRAEIAALADEMCELQLRLRGLVSAYSWDSDVLAERLVGHILRDAHDRYVEIYKAIKEMERHFID